MNNDNITTNQHTFNSVLEDVTNNKKLKFPYNTKKIALSSQNENTRTPLTWGSNLINVTELPVHTYESLISDDDDSRLDLTDSAEEENFVMTKTSKLARTSTVRFKNEKKPRKISDNDFKIAEHVLRKFDESCKNKSQTTPMKLPKSAHSDSPSLNLVAPMTNNKKLILQKKNKIALSSQNENTRTPLTWGSNLINVTELPVHTYESLISDDDDSRLDLTDSAEEENFEMTKTSKLARTSTVRFKNEKKPKKISDNDFKIAEHVLRKFDESCKNKSQTTPMKLPKSAHSDSPSLNLVAPSYYYRVGQKQTSKK
ncbi:hypothetical protein FQR65_LT13864 [Abscondita terminalis]|nr:hypothetical protein FQR65_LT13864 [Abscondita terminalis]